MGWFWNNNPNYQTILGVGMVGAVTGGVIFLIESFFKEDRRSEDRFNDAKFIEAENRQLTTEDNVADSDDNPIDTVDSDHGAELIDFIAILDFKQSHNLAKGE